MGKTSRLSQAERERIAQALRAGGTVHAVAREFGRSKDTVSRIAAAFDIDLGRSAPKRATEARMADVRARLSELSIGLVEDAHRLRGQLFAPHTTFSFGGKDNVYTEHEIPEPTARDKQALMTSIGIAVDKVNAITRQDDDGALAAVDGWLRDVIGQTKG
jgi:transposase-like protein